MNPENRWSKKAETILWNEIEEQYEYSDRELVEQNRENPYYQFFIGLPGYQDEEPFVPSLLVEFRKRRTDDILGDINEMIIAYNTSDDEPPTGDSGGNGEYPESVLTAQNNRTRKNRAYCKKRDTDVRSCARQTQADDF